MSRSGHSLTVSPSLTVICFRRPNSRLGPLFVVREWDAKVIRVSKTQKAKGMSTEQALRANVRQAILNMNLHLEPANKLEIQYLKSVGILGKRAPSCSLLYAKDLLRLLLAFDRKRVAEDLRHALGDESKFALEDDPGRVIPRILIRSQHPALNPVELSAFTKTPLQPEHYSIRQVAVSISKATSMAIAKLLKTNGGAVPRRLLVPDESGTASAAAAPAAAASRSGKSKSKAKSGAAGSKRKNTSALDALLSVLGDAKHGDMDDDEEMAQAQAAEDEQQQAMLLHQQQAQEDEEEEDEEEDEEAEHGARSHAAAAHYNGSARSYDESHSKRRKRSHAVPALAAAVAAAASSSDEYGSPALGYGRHESGSGSHVPVSSPPSLRPASMDSPPPASSSGGEFAVPAPRVRGHHHHGTSGSSSAGGGGLPAALVLPPSPDHSLAPSPAASLFRSTLLSPLLPSSSVPSPSPSPSPPLPSTPSELINSLRASLSVEEARKIASLFAAKASEAAAAAQTQSRPQSRASVSTAGGSGGGGGHASVSAVATAAAAAVADSLLLSMDTPRSFHTPTDLLSPSIMRRLLSPSSASFTVHPTFPGVLAMPSAASSASASAAASSTPLGSPPMLRSSSQPSSADGDSPEPASLLSSAASSARLSSRRVDRHSLSSVPPSPVGGAMHPPPLPHQLGQPMQSPTPAPFTMSDGGMGSSGSGANEAAPVPFSMPLGAFAGDADSAF